MADISDKGVRRLPYPLLNPLSTSQDTPDEPIDFPTIDVFPIDPDEPIAIKLELSLNEYVALSSALDVGRDIAYSEDTTMLWWLWTKVFKGLAANMSCEDVADCVESELVINETLINSVTNTINLNGFGDTNHANPTITKIPDRNPAGSLAEPIFNQPECNLNALWAGIRDGIVQRMDDNARTVLENLAAINDVPERLQTLLDVIPVVGDLAEFFVTNLTQVIPDIENLYAAHSSIEAMDEIACDLFALVCDECRYPSYDEVLNYYKSYGLASGEDIADLTLQMITDFVTGSATTAAEVTYFTVQTWQLFTWYLQATFNGKSGTRTLIEYARLGEDFANNNWLDLCNSCNEAYSKKVWDFTQSPNPANTTGGYFLGAQGVYIAGKGWGNVPYSESPTTGVMRVGLNIDPSWKIRAFGLKFNQPEGNGALTNLDLRTIRGTQAGASGFGSSWGTDGWTFYNNGLLSLTGYQELAFSYSAAMSLDRYLTHIAIIFDAGFAPPDAIPTDDPTLSGTVFP